MVELVEYIAKSLTDQPDKLKVVHDEEDGVLNIKLLVAEEDMGKVIGRQGRIANAIRTVVKAASIKDGIMVNIDIDSL